MQLTAEQARELAKDFYDLSKQLGNYRFAHFTDLSKEKRETLEALEWTLLNASTDFTTMAIDIVLENLEPTLESIRQTTRRMSKAVEKLQKYDKVVQVAALAVRLAGAVYSARIEVILATIQDAGKLFTEDAPETENE